MGTRELGKGEGTVVGALTSHQRARVASWTLHHYACKSCNGLVTHQGVGVGGCVSVEGGEVYYTPGHFTLGIL